MKGVLCFTTLLLLNDIEEFLSVMTYFQLSAKSFVVRLSFPVGCCHIPQVIRSVYGYNIFSFFFTGVLYVDIREFLSKQEKGGYLVSEAARTTTWQRNT